MNPKTREALELVRQVFEQTAATAAQHRALAAALAHLVEVCTPAPAPAPEPAPVAK